MAEIGQSAGNPPTGEPRNRKHASDSNVRPKRGSSETTRQASILRKRAMNLDPDWVVGFVDGEGCFYIGINPHPEMSIGYQVLPEFRVVQHERDIQVLHALKRFFGHGVVRRNHENRFELRIRRLAALREVADFFEKHPLKTKKAVDARKFARVIRLMQEDRHLDNEGLVAIIEIACSMNRADKVQAREIMATLKSKEPEVGDETSTKDSG